MRLVQLRIFTGDPETPGDPVFVAPDNVGSVSFFLADPPAAEVHLKTGPLSHVVDGSAERVAMLLAEGKIDRLPVRTAGVCGCGACAPGAIHASDCAVHRAPAYPAGACDCGLSPAR